MKREKEKNSIKRRTFIEEPNLDGREKIRKASEEMKIKLRPERREGIFQGGVMSREFYTETPAAEKTRGQKATDRFQEIKEDWIVASKGEWDKQEG